MLTKISFCGYFCPAAYSLTGRLIDRLEESNRLFMPIKKNSSFSYKLAITSARTISAAAVALAAFVDILWWLEKTFITDNFFFLINGHYPISRIENLAVLISCFATIALSLAMPFGYLPKVSGGDTTFYRRFTGSQQEDTYLQLRFLRRTRLALDSELDREHQKLRDEKNYQGFLDSACILGDSCEEAVKYAYEALINGANPNTTVSALKKKEAGMDWDAVYYHPLVMLLLSVSLPISEEDERCIRIAKMLVYAGSRLPASLEHPNIPIESQKVIKTIYDAILSELDAERNAFVDTCYTQADLNTLPKPVVQMFAEYWVPPFEKFLTPQTP